MARNKDFEIEVLGARQLKKRLDAGNLLYIPLRKYFNETGKL